MSFEPLYFINVVENTAEFDRLSGTGASGSHVGSTTDSRRNVDYTEVSTPQSGIGVPFVERESVQTKSGVTKLG